MRFLFSELSATSGGRELAFEVVQLPQPHRETIIRFDHKRFARFLRTAKFATQILLFDFCLSG
jgi:hypothetical protein